MIYLGIGIQSNQAALLRTGGFYPDHGLERIVGFHERQDARYAEAACDASDAVRQAGAGGHRAGRHPPRQPRARARSASAAASATRRPTGPSPPSTTSGATAAGATPAASTDRDLDRTGGGTARRPAGHRRRRPSLVGRGDRRLVALGATGVASGDERSARWPGASPGRTPSSTPILSPCAASSTRSPTRPPTTVCAPVSTRSSPPSRPTPASTSTVGDGPATSTAPTTAGRRRRPRSCSPRSPPSTTSAPDHRFTTDGARRRRPPAGVVAGDLYLRRRRRPDPGHGAPTSPAIAQPAPDLQPTSSSWPTRGRPPACTGSTARSSATRSRYDTVRYNPIWPSRFVAQDQTGPLSGAVGQRRLRRTVARGRPARSVPLADPAALRRRRCSTDAARRPGRGRRRRARAGPTPEGASTLAALESPPLDRRSSAQMLRESDNNTAELLLKELGRQRSGDGHHRRRASAVSASPRRRRLRPRRRGRRRRLRARPPRTRHLRPARRPARPRPDPSRDRGRLAVAGETRHPARRFADTELAGRLRAKTGTLNQVTALAGFADARRRRRGPVRLRRQPGRRRSMQRSMIAAQRATGRAPGRATRTAPTRRRPRCRPAARGHPAATTGHGRAADVPARVGALPVAGPAAPRLRTAVPGPGAATCLGRSTASSASA